MKRNSVLCSRRLGFTLVELLVVIAIIVVLAGLGMVAMTKAQDTAKKTQAKSHVTNLVIGVETYYQDNSQLPAVNAESDEIDIRSDEVLMNIMVGIDVVNNVSKTEYFNSPTAKGSPGSYSNGLVRDATRALLFDPWGEQYYLRFDVDFDGQISNDPLRASSGPSPIYNQRVIAFSYGKDKQPLGLDDVQSWK